MRFLALFLCSLALPAVSLAEDYVPESRVAISRNVDFYGSDLANIFDTTLDACQTACLTNSQCRAFTFNQRSGACFPKAGVSELSPYDGAISGRILPTDPAVLGFATARATDLSFLRDADLEAAYTLAREIGRLHSSDERSAADLLAAARAREASGDLLNAFRLTGASVSVSDLPETWLDYARLARLANSSDRNEQSRMRGRAIPATIAAYLRAPTDGARATALGDLAIALEAGGRGRDMIPALRLALDIQPRRDIEAQLDDAIAKYGFRVADTQIEAEIASPRICAIFSEPLIRAGVDYTPFVQLPDSRLTVETSGDRLCIAGVDHGSRTRIVLREGLPAASGEALVRPVELTLYVRDRSPSVSVVTNGYVLPRTSEAAIPLQSVNLPEAELTLYRMTDRNLVRAMQEDLLGSPLYGWSEGYLSAQMATETWSGTAELQVELNRDMLTRVPLAEPLEGQEPGIFALVARVPGADPYETPPATQWFVLSDLGVATFLGTDGLTVAVRSLADASAADGAEVTLLSEANAVLGTALSDAEGVARFDPGLTRGTGSAAPAMVTVRKGDDLAFLSLTAAAFDLSDRGVEGRDPAGAIDTFIATDRGAYRAGEVIHLTALARDASAAALPGLPLTAILRRPDGVEYSRHFSGDDIAGGHVFALPVAASAPRGPWRISVHADVDAPALASTTVLVEDFLPERIDFDLTLPDGAIRLGDVPMLDLSARYLFGPPAADLAVEGDVLLQAASAVEGFDGYRFGRHDERFDARRDVLPGTRTDSDGEARLAVPLPEVSAEGRPLEMRVTARVSEGSGRPVERQITAPVLPDGPMIGINPRFDGVVPEGGRARFALIGLGPDLSPAEMQVKWTVNRVRTRYQWYSLYGSWEWDAVTTRTEVASGTVALGGDPVEVSADVDWGRYEIVVERTDGSYVASSTGFYAGWYAPADAGDTPDLLEASLDAESYQIGDTATFRIVPRYAGTALVTVMSNRVIHMEAVAVTEGENLIPLTVTDDWGAGAYVTASVIRPMDVQAGHNPARALGLGYASVDPGPKQLSVRLDAPEVMRPRQPMTVGIDVAGLSEGDTAHVTLAAVDLGILNITGFDSPDPSGHYFGQRRLGVELRDLYGRLIDGLNGSMGAVRSGGDAMAQMGMQSPPPTEELVTFFEGPVTIGPDGRAEVSFDLPAFNGTVRLMAIAWSETGVGQAEADVLVRDPVVLTASAPRFFAPGDQSRILLEIVHADGPAGEMALRVQGDGVALAAQEVPARFTLAEGEKVSFGLPIAAVDPGIHEVTLVLTSPDGTTLERSLTIPVVRNDPQMTRQSRFSLAPGEVFTFDGNVFAGLADGTGSATLSVGPLARFDAPGLLNALDRYPYGCTEQVTSQAMPLLYFDEVATAMGLAGRDRVSDRIDQAVAEVLANQSANGAFGLWGPYSGDLWLDAYVSDFLSRARAQGRDVPDIAFRNAIDNLRNRVNYYPDFDSGGTDLAYALMVLAREGAAAVGDLRYYADQRAEAFSTPLALAQLGTALAMYGDQTRADALFRRAGVLLAARFVDGSEAPIWRADFGTTHRDAAAVLALAVEAGSTAVDRDMIARQVANSGRHLSTQEAAWTLMAANALIADLSTAGIKFDGEPVTGPLVRVLEGQTDAAPIRVSNTGDRAAELTVTTFGVPATPEPAGGNGYAIERSYYTMDGDPVAPSDVSVGTRLVTVLTVTPFGRQEGRLMVSDPLAAGYEIDNPNLLNAGDIRALDWLDPVATQSAEFRSDRFLAAVDWRSDQPFRLAYIARAVSPGTFHHPAASVEDMYRPDRRAWTNAGEVTILQ
ncbi:alpha-2-macroglobulin family protein [Loktanella sp. IMCC34160]|uniref:alpha-2-macroglobulin family protein n=1 Tax=Loktanella sp. IMCC34160 TaxID=2510646 RepID=UPI00101E1EB2|nr:alpha-2-macroglobulin family protein [Loktanella sp. IMCC34160]RYG91160.1 alpha-2-macroglobulin family protein [Loktanella sp. IMCC34160]